MTLVIGYARLVKIECFYLNRMKKKCPINFEFPFFQNPDNFIANLWDTPESTTTMSQPTNIWGNNGLWSDAGLGGRGNQQHNNATPTSSNYIGGLSVHGPGTQQQAPPPTPNYGGQPSRGVDPFGPRPDLTHSDSNNAMIRPNLTQNDAVPVSGNGSSGFNGLFPPVMTSIWSNTQTQQPHEVGVQQQQQIVSRSNDELNQFQQNRVSILQQPPTSASGIGQDQTGSIRIIPDTTVVSTPSAASMASMNTTNSWSNTLFRQNK